MIVFFTGRLCFSETLLLRSLSEPLRAATPRARHGSRRPELRAAMPAHRAASGCKALRWLPSAQVFAVARTPHLHARCAGFGVWVGVAAMQRIRHTSGSSAPGTCSAPGTPVVAMWCPPDEKVSGRGGGRAAAGGPGGGAGLHRLQQPRDGARRRPEHVDGQRGACRRRRTCWPAWPRREVRV